MSADNWGICPRCYKKEIDNKNKLQEKLKNSYGKVPEDDYLLLKQKADVPIDKEKLRTLREDYEIETNEDGDFSMRYTCSCEKCKLSREYNYDDIIE